MKLSTKNIVLYGLVIVLLYMVLNTKVSGFEPIMQGRVRQPVRRPDFKRRSRASSTQSRFYK